MALGLGVVHWFGPWHHHSYCCFQPTVCTYSSHLKSASWLVEPAIIIARMKSSPTSQTMPCRGHQRFQQMPSPSTGWNLARRGRCGCSAGMELWLQQKGLGPPNAEGSGQCASLCWVRVVMMVVPMTFVPVNKWPWCIRAMPVQPALSTQIAPHQLVFGEPAIHSGGPPKMVWPCQSTPASKIYVGGSCAWRHLMAMSWRWHRSSRMLVMSIGSRGWQLSSN